jgi:hypothetical protein
MSEPDHATVSSRMATRFREQADACAELGSPIYSELLRRVADDIVAGGASTEVLAGHEEDPGPSALALRLAGSVHRLVLDGRAPGLAAYYPSTGGSWDQEPAWTAFEQVLRQEGTALRKWLPQPPQTNEVGRGSALVGGLLRIGERYRLPVRILEIGSSAGLNLRADTFFLSDDVNGVVHQGDPGLVRLPGAWRGRPLRPWPELQVLERLGSDLAPLDVSRREDQLTLMSYVWPDQAERLARLEDAIRTARTVPAEVRHQDAVSFVRDIELVEGTTTVLWHSVMWQYLPAADQQAVTSRIEELGAAASETSPFAHLSLEPARRTPGSGHEFLVVLRLWPTGARRIIGASVAHGVPTTWE